MVSAGHSSIDSPSSRPPRRLAPAGGPEPHGRRIGRWSHQAWYRLTAPQLFAGSFLVLILLGTVGLRTLPGLYAGEPLGWGDALFTATSAVCVTGLIVVDTATFFSPWGQAYVLLLIQVGGLGILTFTTLVINGLGLRLSLRHESLISEPSAFAPHVDSRRLTRDVVAFALGVEAVGAVALWALWVPDLGARGALWPAVFHSVSAFCNAGFSTFTDSLVGAAQQPALLSVVMALIVVGGLGFVVLEELLLLARARLGGRRFRLSVHSRLVLATTTVLVVGGAVLFTAFEWERTFAGMPAGLKAVQGLFLSVTARTAGFNTIDYAAAGSNTNFLTVLLMSVGGSPGSTAGGLKTTAAALIVLGAWARLRGDPHVSLWHRSVPEESLQRSIGLFVVAFAVVTVAIFVLTSTEAAAGGTFLALMFEAASAFNTVGLSMGVTAGLSESGRAALILLMFLGRIGPLTFAAALSHRRRPSRFHDAYEDVGVG